MRRALVLRPEPGARATVERARERGLDVVVVPLFEIEPLAWDASDPRRFDGLLLTSANALWNSGEKLNALRALPVYAIGESTAEAARQAGFSIAATGNRDIERLLASIEPGLELLHLCGEDRRIPSTVRQQITPLTVYRAKPIEAPELGAAEGAVALIHSPRAGRRFAELMRDRRSIAIAAISPAAADAAGGGWEAVEAAPQPNDDALLALAARLCNKPPPE
jgi:uroporphyrinogen-III synthase